MIYYKGGLHIKCKRPVQKVKGNHQSCKKSCQKVQIENNHSHTNYKPLVSEKAQRYLRWVDLYFVLLDNLTPLFQLGDDK